MTLLLVMACFAKASDAVDQVPNLSKQLQAKAELTILKKLSYSEERNGFVPPWQPQRFICGGPINYNYLIEMPAKYYTVETIREFKRWTPINGTSKNILYYHIRL